MNTIESLMALRERPRGCCVMTQSWEHLLFLHWRYDPEAIQRSLPAGLTVNTFDGSAWLAVVPFLMKNVRPAGLPAVGPISNFLENNVRTYVRDADGNCGVWFYSLDCNQPIAVEIARRFFKLNYVHSKMSVNVLDNGIVYRNRPRGTRTQFFRYRPHPAESVPRPRSLEFFLLERYLLFTVNPNRKTIHRGRVHHEPYRYRPVEVPAWSAAGIQHIGLEGPNRPPDHSMYVRKVDVEIFPLQ